MGWKDARLGGAVPGSFVQWGFQKMSAKWWEKEGEERGSCVAVLRGLNYRIRFVVRLSVEQGILTRPPERKEKWWQDMRS